MARPSSRRWNCSADAEDVAPTSAAWSPSTGPAPDADPDLETAAGFADLLAGAALDVPLGT